MPFAALCDAVAAGTGGPAVSSADVAMHDDVAVVRLRGELGASVLHAYLSDIWWQARAGSVVDLAELAFIDCACLGVLVRHCKQIRGQGGSFALAGPQPGVRAVLAATGLLTWFEVHDTVREAVADAGTQRSGSASAPAMTTFFGAPAGAARCLAGHPAVRSRSSEESR